jgi:hypothetical protein
LTINLKTNTVMKKILWLCSFLVLVISFTSCLRDDCTSTREYIIYNPVYMHVNQFRADEVQVTPTRVLESPGKLYFYKNYLLVNEMAFGIHVYDVSDSSNPTEVAFYDIPGNFDMAIKDDILFADNVIDLIAIDISDVSQPRIVDRVENYKEVWEPENQTFYAYNVRSNQTEIVDCSDPDNGRLDFWRGEVLWVAAEDAGGFGNVANQPGGGGQSGIGGSFARFTIASNHLYTVDTYQLSVWSFSGGQLEKENTNSLGWGIETIFPYKDKLFIGSSTGMFIFDNSNPTSPVLLSNFQHATACDPVVVNNDIAYVTLRDGSECNGFTNQLDVVDVSSLTNPKLIKSYPMTNPHGLSVNGNRVYMGEGSYGLRILDVSDPSDVKKVEFYEDIPTYDVISLSDSKVFIVGEGGFYILDATKADDVKILSHIQVTKQ